MTAGMPERIWGTLPSFFTGAVFSLGLILVIVAGSELLTGNMALVPLAAMRGRASFKRLAENWLFVLFGNLLGSLFVAGAYWYLYAQEEHEEPGDTPSGAPERAPDRVTVGTGA